MAFDEVRLSVWVERGALGGPGFKTNVVVGDSGDEQRNQEWTQQRAEWDLSYGVMRMEDDGLVQLAVEEVRDFYYMRRGAHRGFLFKDWSDFKCGDPDNPTSSTALVVAYGDDTTGPFQLVKRYVDGVAPDYTRSIYKPVAGTLTLYREAVLLSTPADYTIDSLGAITLTSALLSTGGSGPGGEEELKANFEFDVPVRFDENDEILRINVIWAQAGDIPQINIFEIKDPS